MSKIDIGSIIDIGLTVTKALTDQSKKGSNGLKPSEVSTVAPKVAANVEKEIQEKLQPVVDNLTNSEPWYKSRVLRGAAWAVCTTAYVAFMDWNADGVISNEALGGYVSAFGANFYIIYGRLTNSGTPSV